MTSLLPPARDRQIAALAYLWITAVLFLFLPGFRNRSYVRFHSWQAVFFGLAVLGVDKACGFVTRFMDPRGSTMLVFATFWGAVRLGLFLIWILSLTKAYQGLEYKLPLIGRLAWKYSR